MTGQLASPIKAGQFGTFADFYFALTSEAGSWSFEELADWQRAAGLVPQKPIRLRSLPGTGMQVGMQPAV